MNPRVAYFSMEIALDSSIPGKSGGLGFLSGDTLRSCADLDKPVVGVSLLYSLGFFHQKIDENGMQVEMAEIWEPDKNEHLTKLDKTVDVSIENRLVKVGAWIYDVKGQDGYKVPVILLDTNLEGNASWDKKITLQLYKGSGCLEERQYHRLTQEAVLGIGGVRMLKELGFNEIDRYHMNEGHAALLTLELLKWYQDKNKVREKCVFTTHTPINDGHDVFCYKSVKNILGEIVPYNIDSFGGKDDLNMSLLAANMSRYINAVSRKHMEVSKNLEVFRGKDIDYITNGVHLPTWMSPSFGNLFDKYIAGWKKDPLLFNNVFSIPSEEIDKARKNSKKELVDFINAETKAGFNYEDLTMAWCRRFVPYKRPDLILSDLERLVKVANGRLQLIFGGKTHPDHKDGKELIRSTIRKSKSNTKIKAVFIEDYNKDKAKKLIQSDVWLNTPKRPREASGTSGMKVLPNGCINFSVLDGWWIEGYEMNNEAGFVIGPHPSESCLCDYDERLDADDLYKKLENVILPEFYNHREKWIERIKHSIKLTSYFNTHRMVEEYSKKAWGL